MKAERRRLTRVNLHLPVLVLRSGAEEPLRSETTDISNGGFHFTSEVPMNPGDKLTCLIALPGHGVVKDGLLINCEAEVVRVVTRAEIRGFGIGCRIAKYSVVPNREHHELVSS
jgi:c-di-GMP-binding flagellar brake protein YcgR